jgi:hypothetical protein
MNLLTATTATTTTKVQEAQVLPVVLLNNTIELGLQFTLLQKTISLSEYQRRITTAISLLVEA